MDHSPAATTNSQDLDWCCSASTDPPVQKDDYSFLTTLSRSHSRVSSLHEQEEEKPFDTFSCAGHVLMW